LGAIRGGAGPPAPPRPSAGIWSSSPAVRYHEPRINKTARDENADVIGLSRHSWEHLHHIDELLALLGEQGLPIPVVVGGSGLTAADERLLRGKGVAATFGPGSSVEDIPGAIRSLVTGGRRP